MAPGMQMRRGTIVLGPYRSGTSLVCQILDRLGVDFGPRERLGPADRFNPGGYFERRDINHVNNRLLETAGRSFACPGDPATLPDEADLRVFGEADLSWLQRRQSWGMKDPRMCATLGAWFDAGVFGEDDVRIVRVERDLDAVARSAGRYPGVSHFYDGSAAAIRRGVEEYDELAQAQLDHYEVPSVVIRYERLIEEPRSAVEELARFVSVTAARRVRRAVAVVGKKRARFRLMSQRIGHRLARLLPGPKTS